LSICPECDFPDRVGRRLEGNFPTPPSFVAEEAVMDPDRFSVQESEQARIGGDIGA